MTQKHPDRKLLRPTRKGLIVRDPDTRHPLPEAGAVKEFTIYWRRRVRDGDVEIVADAQPVPKPEPKAKAATSPTPKPVEPKPAGGKEK